MVMSDYNDNRVYQTQQTILAALFIIVAFVGGCWFMAFRHISHVPATETIVIELPETETRPAEVVEVIREKPERKYYGALFHPFGFMILGLSVVGAGTVLIVWVARHGRQ
jgi:hypothetical protein